MSLILGTMTFGESVFEPETEEFIKTFSDAGYDLLDTAYVYNDGVCEKLIGNALPKLNKNIKIATKVNPRITGKLDAEAAYKQVGESLERLKRDSVDTVFLHFPDPATPVEEVLYAMADLHDKGKFKELGLSNFPAWMVADAWHICDKRGWVKPTVFEGIYNPLTRKAEGELKDCLKCFGMRFYAYNPLCGGLLTGKYEKFEDAPSDGRFTHRPNYLRRYWKQSFFDAFDLIKDASVKYGISAVEATYRWLLYHSMLDGERGDAVIVGVSKLSHLQQILKTPGAGPLPEELVSAFEAAWDIAKNDSPPYYTLYKGKGSVGGEKANA
ncbi:MAG: aldo/keto reductase [Clostridia bacterium]|nr:aldo/keto reductase [Clostridia bacterium]